MSTHAPTILDLKTSFLRSQILALSTPLRPSASYTSSISIQENALRQKSIDDALNKLNAQLRKHNKCHYAPQAQRHVAEQIDRLYWGAGERSAVGVQVDDWSARGTDYRKEDVIAQLPEEWSEEAETKAPNEAARYKELQARLVELSERRKVARERVEQYRAAKGLLEPFESVEGVQGNLVSRNGEVERELERMRMLMLRVERGVGGLEGGESMDLDGDGEVDLEEDERRKLVALLVGDE